MTDRIVSLPDVAETGTVSAWRPSEHALERVRYMHDNAVTLAASLDKPAAEQTAHPVEDGK